MLHKRFLNVFFALLTAAIVAGGGVLFVLHHSLMMNAQRMTHVMTSTSQGCLGEQHCSKVCDGTQSVIAPLAQNILQDHALIPLPVSVVGIGLILSLILLSYLEPILKRPPKLYLAYSVIRI